MLSHGLAAQKRSFFNHRGAPDAIVDRRPIGPNFNPEVGFIERTDSDETFAQFASIAPANPPQVRETRFAVKWAYPFRLNHPNKK